MKNANFNSHRFSWVPPCFNNKNRMFENEACSMCWDAVSAPLTIKGHLYVLPSTYAAMTKVCSPGNQMQLQVKAGVHVNKSEI